MFQERWTREEHHATQQRFSNGRQIPYFENKACAANAGFNNASQKSLGIGMKEIGMFEYDPVFGSFSYPSSGSEFDSITMIPQCWILRALEPKRDRGT
jgi:hypothetical protein